ncbi:MAG: hypothetical protein AABZ55_16015, partial [Bdellovibrionota bacterium]
GSRFDNEPTGFVFNDNDGEAYPYGYDTELEQYVDNTGKVYVPSTPATHIESTIYDSVTNTYRYTYGGVEWSSPGEGQWTSETGQQVNLPSVPAPIGRENEGYYTTPSGKSWIYDESSNKWTETTTNEYYVVAPNNQYRYDEENGRYTDSQGNSYDSNNYGGVWSYDDSNKQWFSSETGDSYNPSTGSITRADGTVVTQESEGCWGCYHDSSGQSTGYTYDYNSHYEQQPDGGYAYYSGTDGYRGPGSVTDSQGNYWVRGQDGAWSSSDVPGATYSYGGYYDSSGNYQVSTSPYTGGGGYNAEGQYVGGDYGAYYADGTPSGGSTYTQNTDGTWN